MSASAVDDAESGTPGAPTPPSGASGIRLLPIDASCVHAVAHIGFHSFAAFSASVNQPAEFPSVEIYRDVVLAELDKPHTFTRMAVRDAALRKDGPQYVDGIGEVLGSVIMDCTAEVAAIGPISVATAAQNLGVGRQLMASCIAESARRGFRSLRLCQIAANGPAFALYHSLGFRAVEYMMHCKGAISPVHSAAIAEEMSRAGITVRPMTAADLPACERLHLAAQSFSRLGSLTYAFHAQRAERLQHKLEQPAHTADNPDGEPERACFVAEDSTGAVVGYSDGFDVDSHHIGTTDAVIIALYHRLGEELKAAGPMVPDILVLTRQHGALVDRLARLGVRLMRQVCLMNRGEYVAPHRHVYCPSIMW